MAAGCHGDTGSGCCGNRLFMILSNEIVSNTSLQLSHCERQRRGGGWVGECNTGLIGVCIYSLCERVESEWKVDCKGKLICERCCCEQTGHDGCAYVCLSIYTLEPMHTFHNKSIKCKYLSLICPGQSLWEGCLILMLLLIGSKCLQDSAEMQIWCNRRQNEQRLLNTTWVYLYSVFTRLILLTSWAPFYFWDQVSSVIICHPNYQRLNWGWELIDLSIPMPLSILLVGSILCCFLVGFLCRRKVSLHSFIIRVWTQNTVCFQSKKKSAKPACMVLM